jgi:hypothetical protein
MIQFIMIQFDQEERHSDPLLPFIRPRTEGDERNISVAASRLSDELKVHKET